MESDSNNNSLNKPLPDLSKDTDTVALENGILFYDDSSQIADDTLIFINDIVSNKISKNTAINLQLEKNSITEEKNVVDHTYFTFDNNSGILKIPKEFSMIEPKYIIADKKIDFLEIKVGYSKILKIPLDFSNKIFYHKNPQKFNIDEQLYNNNKFIYHIPWSDLGCEPIVSACLQSNDVFFRIISNDVCSAKLCVKTWTCDDQTHQDLLSSDVNTEFKQFQEEQLMIGPNHFSKDLSLVGCIKGFFLDNIDLNKIDCIEFIINAWTRLKYDNKLMIKIFSDKISNDCYYFSLDDDSYSDKEWDSSIDLSSLSQLSIKIYSSEPQLVKIRILNYNIYKYIGGTGNLWFSFPGGDSYFEFEAYNNNCIKDDSIDLNGASCLAIQGKMTIKQDQIDICPICRSVDSNIILDCSHQYCKECLDDLNFLSDDLKCSLCNVSISKLNQIVTLS